MEPIVSKRRRELAFARFSCGHPFTQILVEVGVEE